MKTYILIIALTCGCFVSTYAQINQRRKGQTADSLRISSGLSPFLEHKKTIKPGYSWDFNLIEPQLPKDNLSKSDTPVKESMPCYKPEGVFSMKIIVPDTTVKYSMQIQKF